MPIIPTSIAPRIDGAKIIIPVEVTVNGRVYSAKAMYDTGAQPTAVISNEFAAKTSMPITGLSTAIGVGGNAVDAKIGKVDRITIPGSGCTVANQEVMITNLGTGSDHDMILGIAFHRDSGASITSIGNDVAVVCAGGAPVTESKMSTALKVAIVAGVVIIGAGVYFFTEKG